MNKRFALWGGLLLAMAVVAFVMIRLAAQEPSATALGMAAANTADSQHKALLAVRAVPTIFINGEILQRVGSIEDYRTAIESHM